MLHPLSPLPRRYWLENSLPIIKKDHEISQRINRHACKKPKKKRATRFSGPAILRSSLTLGFYSERPGITQIAIPVTIKDFVHQTCIDECRYKYRVGALWFTIPCQWSERCLNERLYLSAQQAGCTIGRHSLECHCRSEPIILHNRTVGRMGNILPKGKSIEQRKQ